MDLIKALNEKQLKEVPAVEVGDTVRPREGQGRRS